MMIVKAHNISIKILLQINSALKRNNLTPRYHYSINQKSINMQKQKQKSHPIVVIGGSAIDMYISPSSQDGLVFGRTNEGIVHSSFGGVGRNIAQVIGRLGIQTAFITALGEDDDAQNIIRYMGSTGVDTFPIFTHSYNTGRYVHAMDKGKDILFGLSDMKVNNNMTFQNVYNAYFKDYELTEDTIVQIDSCVTAEALRGIIPFLNQKKVRIFIQGIGNKVLRIFESGCLDQINQLKINRQETQILAEKLNTLGVNQVNDTQTVKQYIQKTIGKHSNYKSKHGLEHRGMILTKGRDGIWAYFNNQQYDLPVIGVNKIYKTNGAGDTLTGAMTASIHRGSTFKQALIYGMCGSKLTIQSPIGKSTISQNLTKELLDMIRQKQTAY